MVEEIPQRIQQSRIFGSSSRVIKMAGLQHEQLLGTGHRVVDRELAGGRHRRIETGSGNMQGKL